MDFSISIAAELILDEINKASSSSSSPKNVVSSPMSLTLILNMLAHGSNGETLDQFLNVLGSKDIEEVNSKSKAIMSLLAASAEGENSENSPQSPPVVRDNDISWNRPPPNFGYPFSTMPPPQWQGSNPFSTPNLNPQSSLKRYYEYDMSLMQKLKRANKGKDPIFKMVNALWVDHDTSLTSSFKEIADSIYKARVKSVNLRTRADEVKNEVNSWAEKETNGLIKEVLSKGTILRPPLCLANALYFKGAWKTPFKVSNTCDEDFHLLNAETRKVPFMIHRHERYCYGSFDDFKLLELPYQQGQSGEKRFSMYIFLPHARDGLKSLVQKLSSNTEKLHPKGFRLSSQELERVLIPKMKFTFDFNGISRMEAKGLTLPFNSGGADFSNMACARESFYVRIFLHKAFIEVNEEGTEAAAVTFCGMGFGCAPMPRNPPSFVADHPFMFMIIETFSNLVVFTGAVLNPELAD